MKLFTITDQITSIQAAIDAPSTWKDERAALRSEVRDLKEELKLVRELAPELLAIVRQLAYGAGVPWHDQVVNARRWLGSHGLKTTEERRLKDGESSFEWPAVNYYNPYR